MKRTVKAFTAAVVLAGGATLMAQSSAPEIQFDSAADLLKTPVENAAFFSSDMIWWRIAYGFLPMPSGTRYIILPR